MKKCADGMKSKSQMKRLKDQAPMAKGKSDMGKAKKSKSKK